MVKLPDVKDVAAISVIAILMMYLPTTLQAQSASRITEEIDNKAVTVLPHTIHPFAIVANDRGRVDSNLPMQRMVLLFKASPQQATALQKLMESQQDNASPNYRKWLSPEEFAAQFGPNDADLKQITTWLVQQGFSVETVARGRQWLEFSGTAAQVERALHTEIHHFVVNGRSHVANATDIALPRALTPVVAGIVTLHNFQKRSSQGKMFGVHLDSNSGKLEPDFTTSNGNAHYLVPGDYARIYNTAPLLKSGINGSGISIAIVGRTDIQLSDVQTFRQIFGLPANDPQFVVNGQNPGVTGDELESDLDVEWAGAIAPNATIQFVTSSSTFTTDGVDLSASYIVDNVVAPIMSTSYGQCEKFLGPTENAFYSTIYQQAAAEGITALVSSGDNGPAGCDIPHSYTPAKNGLNINGLASTPYNLAVGGTEFNENGHDNLYWSPKNNPDLSSALGYIPETVWNESCDPTVDPAHCGNGWYALVGSSGGPSSCSFSTVMNNQVTCLGGYHKPSWQAGRGVPGDNVRDVPDLALAAAGGHDGYLICIEGSCQTATVNGHTVLQTAAVVGGTSAAAPSVAGMMALVEQKNGAYQGLANYKMYQLAAADSPTACNSSKLTNPTKSNNCVFHDITLGNNTVPGQQGFAGTAGYDMATGLGTVNAANLVASWNAAQKLDSTTTISSPTNTAQHGQPIGLNVSVSPYSGTGSPSGDFSLTTKYGSVFGGTLANGSFSGGIWNLPGGKYSVSAHYPGNAMFNPSDSSAINVQITPEPSTTKVLAYEFDLAGVVVPVFGPLTYGQRLALQFNVKGNSGVGSASGNVTIDLDNTVRLGTFPLDQAGMGWTEVDNLQNTGLLTGTHTYTLTYKGDHSFLPAKPTNISVVVGKSWPQTYTFAVPGNVIVGAQLHLRLSVSGDGLELPTGTVQLYDNGRKLGLPITLQPYGEQGQGIAQAIASPALSVGSHFLQTIYSGDKNYHPITVNDFYSGQATINVSAATGNPTSIRMQQSAPSISLGQSVTYTVSVKPIKLGGTAPTGSASLVWENNSILAGPTPLVNGVASFTVPWNSAGKIPLSAAYSGDANYGPFSSPIILTSVKPATPKVTLTAASSPVAPKTQTSLTASVVGQPSNPNLSAPYGQVQFFDSVNGTAVHALGFPQYLTTGNGGNPIFTLPIVLPSGSNLITVHYLGSNDWTASDSNSVTVLVQ